MRIKNFKLKIKNYGAIIIFLSFMFLLVSCGGEKKDELKTVVVEKGSIKAEIPSTGVVEPRNRLEIKPPISGRIEQVLVREGQRVRKGQIMAWMSSNDRAALMDAARAKGDEELTYWEDVYKAAPIVAPLNGFIIHRGVEPGQTVTTSDSIMVMADQLIVKAQVDETDIGGILIGQAVEIELDAYPGKGIDGKVEHIAYESETINNVTIYEVDVLPKSVPKYFRAGMSATVNFVMSEETDILVVPIRAVKKVGNQSYVFIAKKGGSKIEHIQIKTGLENTTNIQVVSGLKDGDEVVVPTIKMIEDLNNKFKRHRGPTNPLQKKSNGN